MQRALAAGMLAVAMTSTIGTWVVIRGMSFVGDALAHGVLPGIASPSSSASTRASVPSSRPW